METKTKTWMPCHSNYSIGIGQPLEIERANLTFHCDPLNCSAASSFAERWLTLQYLSDNCTSWIGRCFLYLLKKNLFTLCPFRKHFFTQRVATSGKKTVLNLTSAEWTKCTLGTFQHFYANPVRIREHSDHLIMNENSDWRKQRFTLHNMRILTRHLRTKSGTVFSVLVFLVYCSLVTNIWEILRQISPSFR